MLMVRVDSITTSIRSDDDIWSTIAHFQKLQGVLHLMVAAIRDAITHNLPDGWGIGSAMAWMNQYHVLLVASYRILSRLPMKRAHYAGKPG
jgi:hypothetical protein